jgi:hypothetical protein
VVDNLNLLHLGIVLSAVSCLQLALRDAAGHSMRSLRMFATPALAVLTALAVLLLVATESWLKQIWAGALIVGLLVGAIRGSMMKILVDQMWGRVRLPTGRHTVWIALALMLAVALEVLIAVFGTVVSPYHAFPSAVAALCAGILLGRAVAVAIRIPHAPDYEFGRPQRRR